MQRTSNPQYVPTIRLCLFPRHQALQLMCVHPMRCATCSLCQLRMLDKLPLGKQKKKKKSQTHRYHSRMPAISFTSTVRTEGERRLNGLTQARLVLDYSYQFPYILTPFPIVHGHLLVLLTLVSAPFREANTRHRWLNQLLRHCKSLCPQ